MKLLIALSLLFSLSSFAHDEGHGPKLTDSPRQGGVLTSVIMAKEAGIGTKAKMIYKSELTRTSDGTVRLYIYDDKMNPVDLKRFAPIAKAVLISLVKKGAYDKAAFDLNASEGYFSGKSPAPKKKPYSIDVVLKEGDNTLLTAFDNLD